MRAYTIALALFALGFVMGGVDALGIFPVTLSGSGMTLSESQVTEITSGATSGGASPLYSVTVLLTLGGVFFEGLKTALAISPYLARFGVHPVIILMIQGPIWFIYVAAVVQFFTGRPLKGSE